MKRFLSRLPLFLLFVLVGTAFLSSRHVTLQDPETSQEYQADVVAVVRPGEAIEQTLVSRRSGLNSLQLWLQVESDAEETEEPYDGLVVEIYRQNGADESVARAHFSPQAISSNFPISLDFPALQDPPGQAYRVVLRSFGVPVTVLGRNEDGYAHGELFINGEPQQADLSFRTSYAYNWINLFEDLKTLLSGIWLVVPLAFVLWLPGRLLLSFGNFDKHFDWGERVALSIGLSLAFIPVIMTWTTQLGLAWSSLAVWTAAAVLSILAVWRLRPDVALHRAAARWKAESRWANWNPADLALAFVFLCTLLVRLVMVRDLSAPPWVDSVHHAAIARLIMEKGGFPNSFAPLIPLDAANYHTGFHSILATFTWMSGLSLHSALLLLGQVLNALSVFAVYLFTVTLTKEKGAGVVAALIAGLATPMPAYFTSWGRYTQLTGLLVLPVALSLLVWLWKAKRYRPWALTLAAVATGGLFLIHFRVAAFFGLLILSYLLGDLLLHLRRGDLGRAAFQHVFDLSAAALAAILLSLPWWPAIINTLLLPRLGWGANGQEAFNDFSWGYLTSALGRPALILAYAGFLWGSIQRKIFPFVLALWTALMFLLSNLGVFRLPGGGLVNNTSVEISLFLPISVLGGYVIVWFVDWVRTLLPLHWYPAYQTALALSLVVFVVFAGSNILPILNPITMLYRQADNQAITWMTRHVDPGEKVLINPFSWGYGLYAGQDGGYWLGPLAGLETLPPPVLYGLGKPNLVQKISTTARQVTETAKEPGQLHNLLRQQNIRYVYLGARGGVICGSCLRYSPLFRLLYARNGVQIYEVLPGKPAQ